MKKILLPGIILIILVAIFYFIQKGTNPENSESLNITYPFNNSVFPADIIAPTFNWLDNNMDVTKWHVSVSVSDSVLIKDIETSNKNWHPSTEEWNMMIDKSIGKEITVTVKGINRQVVSQAKVTIQIINDKVEAPIFFRAVPLPFKFARENLKRVRWYLGDISNETKPHSLLDNIPVCANCHSFTPEGETVAMDVDARDDKGAYTISALQKEILFAEDSIIHWSDYQEGKFTYGLLSRISPNGRYVVSTLHDCEIFIDRKDLEYSQLFFPFKGILVVYDRKEKQYFELNGANDTMLVQSNPCWSPDGKYIYFARARAKHFEESGIHNGSVPKPENAPRYNVFERHYLKRDTLIKFNIYRIPFNKGRGGKAVPVAGASHNGYSNYFPKISPDGKWLVFCRAESFMLLQKDSKLFITPTDGGETRQMTCNTDNMNSWHSWSPNSKWLVFSSKAFGPYTQLFLTHINEDGSDSPPVYLEKFSFNKYANNIPEFVNIRYDKEMKINPTFLSDNDFIVRIGEIKLKDGDIEGAFKAFNKAVKMFPEKSEPYFKRGKISFQKGQIIMAIEDFNRAIKLDRLPEYYTSRGIAYLKLDRIDKVIEDLSVASELDPSSFTPLAYLGVAYTKTDKYAQAIKCLEKAVSLYDQDGYTYYYLGLARYSIEDWDKANQAFTQATHLGIPGSVKNHTYVMRGEARLNIGNYTGAIQDLNTAIKLSPNNPASYYLKGKAQLEAGMRNEALKSLNKAKQLGSVEAKILLRKNTEVDPVIN